MKTILKFLATLLLVAAISACDGDKDNDPNPENPENPENPNPNGGNGDNGDNGTGTTADPFKVANVTDLKRVGTGTKGPEGLAWTNDKNYIQVADIDMKDEANWRGICSLGSSGLSGTYDGDGFTISNLTLTGSICLGLFGLVVEGTVKNVRLDNVNVSGDGMVGGLVGQLMKGTIEYCTLNNITVTANHHVGGLVGTNYYSDGTISNCIVTNGTVTCVNSGSGGIVGYNTGKVNNCYVTANVSGPEHIGDVVGINMSAGSVQYCFATGNVEAEIGDIGGIVGYNLGDINSCVALNKMVKNEVKDNHVGRIAGYYDPNPFQESRLQNNYARNNMTLTAGSSNVTLTDATTTSIHGANVTAANYNGSNSGAWWKDTAGFPEEAWDFAANRLPHLKGFGGLTQNPTVTP